MSAFEIQKYWMKCLCVLEHGSFIDNKIKVLRFCVAHVLLFINKSYVVTKILLKNLHSHFKGDSFLDHGSQPVYHDLFGDWTTFLQGSPNNIGKIQILYYNSHKLWLWSRNENKFMVEGHYPGRNCIKGL